MPPSTGELDDRVGRDRSELLALYTRTRARTESLAARLSPEDQQLQSMPEASPSKWHRAHTTWFFEAFVLQPAGVEVASPAYAFLFNSYYEAVGPRHARPLRGLLSRPSAAEVAEYRRVVDGRMIRLLEKVDARALRRLLPVLELGVAHEEADRLVTAFELEAFIAEGGYETPSLWLSEGFDLVRAGGLRAPLYSTHQDGKLWVFTLEGPRALGDDEPVAHVSYYEADAIARFLGGRLPTEAEWEIASQRAAIQGNFADDDRLRPLPAPPPSASGLRQMFGDVWEWTRSSYEPYPGYAPASGALGEYNGKFMVGQQVLRGGSCLTPRRHVRASYRNFWHPATRFQMAGLRLARDLAS